MQLIHQKVPMQEYYNGNAVLILNVENGINTRMAEYDMALNVINRKIMAHIVPDLKKD